MAIGRSGSSLVKMRLRGFHEFDVQLGQLTGKVARKVGRKAVRAGASPFRKRMKKLAPKDTGILSENIKTKIVFYPTVGTISAITGPRVFKDPATGRNPANYFHLVELGFTDRAGAWHEGKHFAERAFDESKSEALERVKKKMAKEIPKEALKLRSGKRAKWTWI